MVSRRFCGGCCCLDADAGRARWRAVLWTVGAGLVAGWMAACGHPDYRPPAIALVHEFGQARVEGQLAPAPEMERLEFRFDGSSPLVAADGAGPLAGWKPILGAPDARISDGLLIVEADGDSIVSARLGEGALAEDLLWAFEVTMRSSGGVTLGILPSREEEIDVERLRERIGDGPVFSPFMADVQASEELQTVTLLASDSPFSSSLGLGAVRHLMLRFTPDEGAAATRSEPTRVAVESLRTVSRRQHLASVPAGIGWHGLSGIFRETVVARSPERVVWSATVAQQAWLDLAVGTPELHPVTFEVAITGRGATPIRLRRTITESDRWEPMAIDLGELRGEIEVALSLEAEDERRIGFWGAPTLRHRGALPETAAATPARRRLSERGAPRGVIVIVADTLRRDHLTPWGYQRETAPTLQALADGGTVFLDNVSQGSWTKVAVPSLLTSLYATSHGIFDYQHRVAAAVTTLAEAFRTRGYATFHTSAVTFSGRNSNLQQGVEELHERSSVDDLGDYESKTARTYVDRALPWIEAHRDQPFFVFLHLFDPHSPFRPFAPYDRRFLDDRQIAEHETNLEAIEEKGEMFFGLPAPGDFEKAEVDPEVFVAAEHGWYDGSIRAMDAEIARLLERLETLGLRDDVLLAFVADHGEEFLEHGRHWHGQSVYGELVNVPMLVYWPSVVPAGLRVERTTQSIDLMPTLLELARQPIPEGAQGRSLVPLLAAPEDPFAFGFEDAPAFTERVDPPNEQTPGSADSYAVVADGWKLIWNVVARDDRPEYELFDHVADPLDLNDVANAHPDRVAELRSLIEAWRERAEAARVASDETSELDPEELERLRALGYLK